MSVLPASPTALRALQALCFVWAGLVIGISFLEAPVKFTAPSLTRAAGLDVGRHVFTALNRVELAAAVLAVGLAAVGRPDGALRWGLAGVLAVLAVQTVWLLPELKAQARHIIDGGRGPAGPNYAHLGYGVLEAAKVLVLIAVAWGLDP